jgi:hypothetical protein
MADEYNPRRFHSGTYTPTGTGVVNVTAFTTQVCQFARVGNFVQVAGVVNITPTANNVGTQLRLSLPVPSAFTLITDLSGVGANSIDGNVDNVFADVVNDEAVIQFVSVLALGIEIHYFQFAYQVI